MTEFQGIPIDEKLLLRHIAVESVVLFLFLCVAIAVLYWVISLLKPTANERRQNNKVAARIHKLQEIAAKDPKAQKELTRRRRKQQRSIRQKRKANTPLLVGTVLLLAIIVGGFFMLILPKQQDYRQKDYVLYHGVCTLHRGHRSCDWINLPDGTCLEYSRFVRDEGTYTGTIVYAPRSKLVLGIEWEESQGNGR